MASTSVTEELGTRIVKVVHKHVDGVPLDQLDLVYYTTFDGIKLDYNLLNFQSMDELVTSVAINFPIHIMDRMGIRRIFLDKNRFYSWLADAKVHKQYSIINIMVDLPPNVVRADQRLPRFQFPQEFINRGCHEILAGDIIDDYKYFKVKIMSFVSPHDIYLNLCGEKYHDSYNQLRIKMRFYDLHENRDKFRIPNLLLDEDYLCAVQNPYKNNEWHRARIVSIDRNAGKDDVTLLLVDTGETLIQKSIELKLLKNEFLEPPPQAIRVQLNAIKPIKNNQWSISCYRFLRQFVESDCQLECAFLQFNEDRFKVYLKNINDDNKMQRRKYSPFLHQRLIDEKHATLTSYDEPQNGTQLSLDLNKCIKNPFYKV